VSHSVRLMVRQRRHIDHIGISRPLAIASHWPFEQRGRFLPEHTTAASILDRLLHHATIVVTDGESYRMKDAQHRKDRP
jgi:DNA replication protein DnaC